MRITPISVAVPVLAASLLLATGCETTPDNGADAPAPAPAPSNDRPARTTSFEQDLLDVKPQLARTMAALDNVVAMADTPNLGAAASEFKRELANVRSAAGRVIADLDEQRRSSDAFFLDRDRTVATTGQPGVLAGRDRVGFVGEYLVQLRRDYFDLTENLDQVESALGGSPTRASVDQAMPFINGARRNSINVENDISVLVDEMRRVNFGS